MSMTKQKRREMISPKDQNKALKRLLSYVFKDYKGLFFLVIVCIAFNCFASVASSYFVGSILIDGFLTPSIYKIDGNTGLPLIQDGVLVTNPDPSGTFASLRVFGLSFNGILYVMMGIFALGVILGYFYNFLMAVIAQGIQKEIRDEMFVHMQDLPVGYFDSNTRGDIMSVYTNDVDSLREMLARAVPMSVSSIISMIACFVMMLVTDIYLLLVVLFVSAIILVLTKYFTTHAGSYFVKQQIELGKTNGYIEESITGQKVIKVFNHEEKNIEGFRVKNEALYEDSTKANRYSSTLMPAVNQLGNLQYAIIALIGGLFMYYGVPGVRLSSAGLIHFYTFGIISSFLLYSKSFVQPIGQVAQQLNSITMALAGATRIFGIIDTPAETDDGYVRLVNAKEGKDHQPVVTEERTGKWAWEHSHQDGSPTTYVWEKGDIVLDHVDFGYTKDKIVLHDITLYAKPGQKIAFVGPTGAGKTTITNLLNRFYDIADGKIRFDGININKIRKEDLRRSIGMVFQETKLFTGTVKENIRYGKLDATDEEVEQAAKLSNADSFIRLLPDGYDTMLANAGESLSQGQRQLLSIARAAISNPPVLILDEATSSIDSRTETLVQKGMDAIMEGRTVFVIAHRLSTVKNSNVIMVLDQGRIIERGTHEDLLKQKGKYYQLYTGKSIAK